MNINPYLLTTSIIQYEVTVDPQVLNSEDSSEILKNSIETFDKKRLSENGKKEVTKCATGFFYRVGNSTEEIYLITNKHVVKPPKTSNPESITLRLRDIYNDEWSGIIFDHKIELYEDDEKIWYEHPNNPNVDVVAIPIDSRLSQQFNTINQNLIYSPTKTELNERTKISHYDTGQDCVVIGYPIGFRDTNTELPIVRKALISSPPFLDFRGEPRFLTDAKMHGGMSGSPVFQSFPIKINTGEAIEYKPHNPRLLGVHSGGFLRKQGLQLNSVWRATLIPEIIKSKSH